MNLGGYQFTNPVFLAPMSGATDSAFRRHASRFGASAVVTEMVASGELVTGHKDTERRLHRFGDEKGPFIVQLAGREAKWMREAAAMSRGAGADIIDINMGCPARKVTGGLSGSALMKDLDRAKSLIDATLEGADGPVTLKMRLGWDSATINAPELAKAAENLGVSMITVHGRTRQQFYEGKADWTKVSNVVEAVDIPVIVNGDIIDAFTAQQALEQSGASGVMIGRAAIGRPWLIGEVQKNLSAKDAPAHLSLEDQVAVVCELVEDSAELYGSELGVRVVRKHIAEFIETSVRLGNSQNRKALRKSLCQKTSINDLLDALSKLPQTTDHRLSEAVVVS